MEGILLALQVSSIRRKCEKYVKLNVANLNTCSKERGVNLKHTTNSDKEIINKLNYFKIKFGIKELIMMVIHGALIIN